MPDYTTETRTYVGEPGTFALNGFGGFSLGQRYEMYLGWWIEGNVVIELPPDWTEVMVVSIEQFEKWFVK